MFNDKQMQALSYELDNSRIKTRQKGNITLSYLEGHDIIEAANKIFGYGNWSYSITSLQQASQEQNHNQNHIICYKAVVSVSIHNEQHSKYISREDVGFGTGIAKTLAEAHEGSAKEAVTDALKRAMRSFGNQFGNSLYDKSRNHSQTNSTAIPQQPVYAQTHTPNRLQQSHNPNDYASLYNLGLNILEQGNNLVVVGDDIFAKKDSIKACGFRWDGNNKLWYKPKEQSYAA